MVISLFIAIAAPLCIGVALMAGDRLGRPLGHTAAASIAGVGAFIALLASIVAAIARPDFDRPWVPTLGIRMHLRVDGISAPLIILAAAVTLLAIAISVRQRVDGRDRTPGLFYGSLLTTLAGALAAFMASDVLVFFIAFEIVLVPMWVLIDRYGDPKADNRRAGWTFVLYTIMGSMFMLAGLLVLINAAGTSDMGALAHGAALTVPFHTQLLAAVLLTIGLAVKVPLIGVHSWLPLAHTAAPTAGSMLLAAVLLKLGTYGFVRLVVLPLPEAWRTISPYVAALAVIGIVFGGLVCLVERDLKRLIAWSSVAHMGFVMLALAVGNELALQAALYGNIAHGVISALLFAVVGALKTRRGPVDIDQPVVGLRNSDPQLGFALVIGLAAALGLPGLAGFWGEALAIFASFTDDRPGVLFPVLAGFAALGSVLAAAYCVRVLRALWAGEVAPEQIVAIEGEEVGDEPHLPGQPQDPEPVSVLPQVRGVELASIGVLAVAVVVLGVAPTLLMHLPAHELAQVLGGAK